MKRVTVEPCSFFHIAILAQVWGTLQKRHLHGTVNVATKEWSGEVASGKNSKHETYKFAVPVKRCGMAGHEEQDVGGLSPAGVTQCVKVRHDIQCASLMDQAGVESCC